MSPFLYAALSTHNNAAILLVTQSICLHFFPH